MEDGLNLNVGGAADENSEVASSTVANEIESLEASVESAEVVEEASDIQNEQSEDNLEVKELIVNIDTHFANVRNLLKFNKDKDSNIAKLTSELQAYREGLESKLFKSIAMSLIGLREDCKKSVREFKERGLSVEDAKKYLNYLVYDYEDFLSNINVVVEDEKVYYNGKLVASGFDKKINVCDIEEYVLPETPKLVSEDNQGIIRYLIDVENYIVEVLKSNSYLDKILKTYIENSALYEQGVHQVILYPVINSIAALYGTIKEEVKNYITELNDNNTIGLFIQCSNNVIEEIDCILTKCFVTIESFVSDQYDPQKHRLLKAIYSNNIEENGKIAKVYSDCYLMDGRVIYPQKVDVIKYKENN